MVHRAVLLPACCCRRDCGQVVVGLTKRSSFRISVAVTVWSLARPGCPTDTTNRGAVKENSHRSCLFVLIFQSHFVIYLQTKTLQTKTLETQTLEQRLWPSRNKDSRNKDSQIRLTKSYSYRSSLRFMMM